MSDERQLVILNCYHKDNGSLGISDRSFRALFILKEGEGDRGRHVHTEDPRDLWSCHLNMLSFLIEREEDI